MLSGAGAERSRAVETSPTGQTGPGTGLQTGLCAARGYGQKAKRAEKATRPGQLNGDFAKELGTQPCG